jgi:glutathione gamma-glutamylcysteinyltransferase
MKSRQAFQRSLRYAATLVGDTCCNHKPRRARVRVLSILSSTGKSFSSLAVNPWDEPDKYHTRAHKHCNTCTCDSDEHHKATTIPTATTARPPSSKPFACGNPQHEDETGVLPPPLPEPRYSVHKRVLPSSLTALSSPQGRKYLLEAMNANTAESYWALTEQFVNQSDPAFCGVTTLLMVLNAMSVDPQIRWRGGWRWYGSEDVLLDRCCLSAERIRRVGVTLDEFRLLGRCHGLSIQLKRPTTQGDEHEQRNYSLDDFRQDIQNILTTCHDDDQHRNNNSTLVVSFSRSALGQTGDGHFSPLAAYHPETDQVLLLDVARFKYAPYWVAVEDLYNSMVPIDSVTEKSRGWFLLEPPKQAVKNASMMTKEDRRPAELVPLVGEGDPCPAGKVKIDYCKANINRNNGRN